MKCGEREDNACDLTIFDELDEILYSYCTISQGAAHILLPTKEDGSDPLEDVQEDAT